MRPLLRAIQGFILIVLPVLFVFSLVVLLNFTAPNPTGRRYSSSPPLITGQANAYQIGSDAERILARDLGITRNEDSPLPECICPTGSPITPASCSVCRAYVPMTASYRVPDFITDDYIAESKNVQGLLYETGTRDTEQIRDFTTAARALDIPLWVFIRVNTEVDAEFQQLVESTGGGVIRYFTLQGYADPSDTLAQTGVVVSGLGLLLGALWLVLPLLVRVNARLPGPRTAPSHKPPAPTAPIDTLEAFTARRTEAYRARLDIETARSDEPGDEHPHNHPPH
jgi:hypothetical protein